MICNTDHLISNIPDLRPSLEQVRTASRRDADNISKNREKVEQREDAYWTRIERQYAGMNARIGGLKATQSYLEPQIKLWNSGND